MSCRARAGKPPMWPNELPKPWPLGIVSFVKPRCHLPTCPVIYPPAFIISANVTCAAGIPALPFDDRRFDGVTANHMLFHVPDRQTAIAEVWRVLKPGGRFLAVTNGENHFLELREMVARFAPGFEALLTVRAFSLQNGGEQLAEVFPQPTTSIFEDRLVITESQPVVDYLKSIASFDGDAQQILQQIEESVAEEIAQDGAFHITKEVGLFQAVRSDASKSHLALLDSR